METNPKALAALEKKILESSGLLVRKPADKCEEAPKGKKTEAK